MIRLIQRRLIIPRGDTGTFTVPALSPGQSDSVGVFTIFDPITKTRVFQKQVELQDGIFNIEFNHGDTVNLQAGDYLWDIKFYINPIIENGKVIDGTEIDSYYAAFSTPKCEIRETGDDFMVIDGQPAKIEDLNIILAATEAANAAKIAATEKAEEAAARLAEMVAAIPTKVSELENDSGYLQEETDPTVPAWAKAQTKPSYTPQEVGALPADTFIPSKVSDLTDDSGHYIKPASGIPASDLEETYLTQHQDISMKANSADLAAVATSGDYSDLDNTPYIPTKTSDLVNDSDYAVDANYVHTDNNYTTTEKEKLAGIAAGAEVNVNADWNAASGDAYILNKPTNVSAFTNDAGYLTEHQDISGKANTADLAAVAISGSYKDLSDKPTIPEVPVQDVQVNGASVLDANGVANIPAASGSVAGVMKVGAGLGVDGSFVTIYKASNKQIKNGAGEYAPIVASVQDRSAFYGLAKAAGDTTQSQSDNAVGTYTDGAKTAIQNMLDVPSNASMTTAISNAIGNINSFDMAVVQALPEQDISTHTIYLVPKTGEINDVYDEYVYINNAWEMVGNTQIDLSNYVQKTDYADAYNAGVVKITSDLGLQKGNGGLIYVNMALDDDIKLGIDSNYVRKNYRPIVPGNQHKSVFYGLAKAAGDTTQSQSDNAVGTYTNEAKAAIRSMIGAAASADLTVQDVQIDGNSIITNGIATIPKANTSVYGVVKTDSTYGIGKTGNGALSITPASSTEIKAGSNMYKALVPIGQHQSTFYGLAKAAGDTTQSQSNNAVGQYTDEAKAAIQTMLDVPAKGDIPEVPVQDVQVNGTSVLENGVANVPMASTTEYGVVKVNAGYGVSMRASEPYVLTLNYASDGGVKAGTNTSAVFSVSKQHLSAFYGLAKAAGHDEKNSAEPVGTYTPEAKGAIQKMLGVSDLIAPEENNLIASKAYKVGEVFTANGKLYKATVAIAQDAAIIPDTNCIETTMADESVRDVQVNGVSVLTDGVANVPIANSTNPGVMKVGTGATGVYISDSTLRIRPAYSDDIKNGSNSFFPVTPNYQHQSVFYGLSKVAGVDMSSSSNAVGTYTDGAKTAIRNMLGATSSNVIAVQDTQPTDTDTKIWLPETEDAGIEVPTYTEFQALDAATVKNVQVNGTTVVSNGVANIPLASSSVTGCIRVDANNGIAINSNTQKIYIDYAGVDTIKAATDSYRAIVPKYAYSATFYGLAKAAGDTTQAASDNAVGTYTADAKAAIRTMIGAGTSNITDAAIGYGTSAYKTILHDNIIRISTAFTTNTSGELLINTPSNIVIKNAGGGWAITPAIQHVSAFYGLAKAAGDTTQAASDNAVGTYTADASAAIRNMLGTVGTSDYANDTTAGVVKVSSDFSTGGGIGINSSGMLFLESTTDNAHQNGTTSRRAVLINKQHAAVFYGLAKAAGDTTMASSSNEIGTYTDEAKAAIHTMLGIDPASIAAQVDIPLVETVSGTTPTITGQPNVRYVCGEVSTISITPPASGSVDVIFESGSTATTMTVPSTVKWPAWFDAETLEANTTYEVLITDGIYGSVMTWAT